MMKAMFALGLFAVSSLLTVSAMAAEKPTTEAITIGSADFPESQLLATIYAKALTAKGIAVNTKLNIGSREVYLPALLDGSIDMIPEYSGATLSYLDKKATAHTPEEVAEALRKALPEGISMLPPSSAQDSDVVVVTKATAEKYKLVTIADLKPVASKLVLGGPPEWKSRKEGVQGLKDVYGLTFKSFKTLDVAGPLTLSALLNGQIDAADMTSTDPAIKRNNLVVLEDTLNLFPAQNIVPIFSAKKVGPEAAAVFNAVSSALTTEDLIVMNGSVDEHESIDVIADRWLTAHKIN
ncbi:MULTISPECIES: ABC transporter substrate-binding protein [unclassified Pseudomonas syringae group]|uniref:ABC transporter substrate-binding protein n=1 Tax=unclassified Pseudomonas syringae group TaxID=2775504 RepID=UPI0029151F90|nr:MULTISPECIES: ABC transporter substrate-binding protein [unclassified Pseudomonas syringae group]MDU8606536.1 ABC transporter substrate-binding protein [Pseudomonas syringae group sp. 247E2]MDU8630363.1 ABC transporter substrate-binding protein [Pseudomonas syringae group sp. 243L2]